MNTLEKKVIHVLGRCRGGADRAVLWRFLHTTQNGTQLKMDELFTSGIFHTRTVVFRSALSIYLLSTCHLQNIRLKGETNVKMANYDPKRR